MFRVMTAADGSVFITKLPAHGIKATCGRGATVCPEAALFSYPIASPREFDHANQLRNVANHGRRDAGRCTCWFGEFLFNKSEILSS
jgi:hypothetical protein